MTMWVEEQEGEFVLFIGLEHKWQEVEQFFTDIVFCAVFLV